MPTNHNNQCTCVECISESAQFRGSHTPPPADSPVHETIRAFGHNLHARTVTVPEFSPDGTNWYRCEAAAVCGTDDADNGRTVDFLAELDRTSPAVRERIIGVIAVKVATRELGTGAGAMVRRHLNVSPTTLAQAIIAWPRQSPDSPPSSDHTRSPSAAGGTGARGVGTGARGAADTGENKPDSERVSDPSDGPSDGPSLPPPDWY